MKTEVLEAKVIDFDWDLKFEIVSFNLYIQNKTVDITEFSKGNKLTDKMRSVIADLEAGQSIIFKDIKAIGPDGRIHDLNPVILKLD